MCLPLGKDTVYAIFDGKVEESSIPQSTGQSSIERSLRNYQEHLTKIILSGNLPRCVSLPSSASNLSSQSVPPSKAVKPSSPLSIHLFNAFTNECLHHCIKLKIPACGLIYASAGNLGGQLSNPAGTHFAQEESTIVDHPHAMQILSQTTQAVHQTEPSFYPVLSYQELHQRLANGEETYTPACGFAITDIYPITLASKPTNIPHHQYFTMDDGNAHLRVSYIIQSALHFGYSMEDESTNFMFNMNPSVTSIEQLFNIRSAISRCTSGPQQQRIALMTIIFSDFPVEEYECKETASSTHSTPPTYRFVYKDLHQHYTTHQGAIMTKYRSVLDEQLRNQILLLQEIGCPTFITGLYGCGVYNHDYVEVANAYGRVIRKHGHFLRNLFIVNRIDEHNVEQMTHFCKLLADAANAGS